MGQIDGCWCVPHPEWGLHPRLLAGRRLLSPMRSFCNLIAGDPTVTIAFVAGVFCSLVVLLALVAWYL